MWSSQQPNINIPTGDGMWLSWLEHQTVTLLMQVWFPGVAREFLPRVNFQCKPSFGVCTFPCAIACINTCAHNKDPVIHVRVRWIIAIQTYPACAIGDKNDQLDDCGCSTERKNKENSRNISPHIYSHKHWWKANARTIHIQVQNYKNLVGYVSLMCAATKQP